MLRWLIRRKLAVEEKRLGVSLDYLRHVLTVSVVAFFRFGSVMPLAECRRVLPADAWFVARLTALKTEDCGSCLQLAVNLAKQSGVSPDLIRAVLAGNTNEMSAEMVDAYQFTNMVLQHTNEEETLRETLRKRYGEQGLIELAYVIASSRIASTVKRSLGYAKSCSPTSV